VIPLAVFLVACYLLGSIPTGYLLVKAVKGIDIRTQGSGNIGMTNVWRVVGASWGVLTLLLDISKGVIAVEGARSLRPDLEWVAVAAGLNVLLGNVFSIFMRFKGGKGIGVSVGVFYSLLPLPSLIGTLVFLCALGVWRMISVGSLSGVTTMAALSMFLGQGQHPWSTGLAMVGVVIAWYTHRSNLKRIADGTENKVNFGKGKGEKA
jgi:glycerol-3-phosphate acyltransferase PlsY